MPSLFAKLRKPLDNLKHVTLYRYAKPRAAAEKTVVGRLERQDLSESTLAELAASVSDLLNELLAAQVVNVDGREELEVGIGGLRGEGGC